VKPEDLTKVKEAQRRDLESNLKENQYWMNQLSYGYKMDDPGLSTKYAEWISNLTSEKIQAVAKELDVKKGIRVVLYPEK
jgi:hypothetical protein